jgi:hypothetical protein
MSPKATGGGPCALTPTNALRALASPFQGEEKEDRNRVVCTMITA